MLRERMPLYNRIPADAQAELQGHIRVFIAEKYFEGCGGLSVTDEMRVLIAAQACVLLLGRETDYFPLMRSVLVYPGPFAGSGKSMGVAGVVTESLGWRRGESWHTPGARGPVVLSWPDVAQGAADPCDGRNVTIHEFAHQLDAESGWVDGSPLIENREAAARWKRVMTGEFQRHIQHVASGLPTLIDPYGAQSPAEFFAVVCETFFERGSELRSMHPDLYALIAGHLRQDPAEWRCRGDGRLSAFEGERSGRCAASAVA